MKRLSLNLRVRLALPGARNTLLFSLEGVLITLVNMLVANNNLLFATRMGASSMELSMVSSLPQLAGLLVLIPGAILTDRLKNKRLMLQLSLSGTLVLYILMGFTPYLNTCGLWSLIALVSLSTGCMTMYNVAWQAFFADVVPEKRRNHVLSVRSPFWMSVNMLMPLTTGLILANVPSVAEKIRVHQIYVWVGAAFILCTAAVVSRITGGEAAQPTRVTVRDFVKVAAGFFKNRYFRSFILVVILANVSWQIMNTIGYISQVYYMGASEFLLGIFTLTMMFGQVLSMFFVPRLNERLGVRLMMIVGAGGFVLSTLGQLLGILLPYGIAIYALAFFNFLAGFLMSPASLNPIQCLYEVVGAKNRTFSIALYNICISFVTAAAQVVGVWLYTLLGENHPSMVWTLSVVLLLRILAVLIWYLYWRRLRGKTGLPGQEEPAGALPG